MSLRTKFCARLLAAVGREFNPGQSAQCAAFISATLLAIGYQGEGSNGWRPTAWVPDYSGADNGRPFGTRISVKQLQPGDLVIFGHTYRDETSTHIGGYVGEGWFVHRPTAARPVEKSWLLDGYWRQKFETGIRLLPEDAAAPPGAGTDGRGQQGDELHRLRLEAHSGKVALRVDGDKRPVERFMSSLAIAEDGRAAGEVQVCTRQGNMVFIQHQPPGGELRQSLKLDNQERHLVDVALDVHGLPGKSLGLQLDLVYR